MLRQCWTQELRRRERIEPLSHAARHQAKKDPKLLTPSLTRHMQLRDLPTGFTSRFVQDKRRMKVSSASDVDVAEFSLPPTAHARKDPREQLTPLDLLAIHTSPSVTARARDTAVASLLSRPRSPRPRFPSAPSYSPGSAASSVSVGGLTGAIEVGRAGRRGPLSLPAHSAKTSRADEGANRDRAGEGNDPESRNTDLGSKRVASNVHPSPRLADTHDLYVELSRIASQTGFTLDAQKALALVPRKRSPAADSYRALLPPEIPASAAGSRRPRSDTLTLRRVLPAAERHKQRSGCRIAGGGWGWRDDREAVKDAFRNHVTVERSSSASPFAFSVVPEEE